MITVLPDGEIVSWDAAAETLFGFPAAEAVGRSLFETTVPPGQEAEERRWIEAAMAAGESDSVFHEALRRRRDGTPLYVDVVARASCNRKGSYVVLTERDATTSRYRRQARGLDARHGLTLESIPDAVVLIDEAGRIAHANGAAQRLFGFDPDRLLGEPVDLLIPEGLLGASSPPGGEVTEPSVRPGRLQGLARRRDGTEFPVEISLGSLQTDGAPLTVASIRDVGERLRQEERRRAASERALRSEAAARSTSAEMNERLVVSSMLQHEVAEVARLASEAKSRFLAAMSHELRTPLNAITGYTGLMEEGIGGPVTAKQEGYLQRIQAAAGHLVGLIDDVLDLAKVESGQMRIEGKPESVGDAIKDAIAFVEPQAVDAGVTLEFEPRAGDCRYVGDPDRMRQILLNLLSNAMKFTDRGGRVTVTFGETAEPHPEASLPGDGPWTFVAVEDTGIGIPAEDAGAVFQPFVRAQVASAKMPPGTGLGLAISRELARRMEGDLTLRSTVGQGSCFTVWLPS